MKNNGKTASNTLDEIQFSSQTRVDVAERTSLRSYSLETSCELEISTSIEESEEEEEGYRVH